MAKYINADEMIADESEAYLFAQIKITDKITRDINYVIHTKLQNLLANAPAADVQEVKHGRWEKVDDNPYEYVAVCSVCHNEIKQPTCMLKPIYSYCPYCGAKMDEVSE